MNITCDPPDNDRLTEMPVIPPPTPRRSPLISGTYKLKGDSNAKPDSKSSSAVHPLTKSAKKTIALLTVSASIVGAFSTIAGFAHSVAPQSIPQPAFTGIATGASILLDHDSIGGPLSALSETGKPLGQCPLQHTTMDAKLSGYVARVNVTQVFTNPYPYKIDARYNFPLSDDSAVDEMTIKVGDRTIKGDIKTREQAKQIYEQAKNGGHAAALLDQERTNIFTQQVANIEPGKSIVVQISYVELLKFEDGRYTFALPTTVAPRFFPEIDHVHAFPKPPNNWGQTLALPGVLSGQNLSINVDIDAGLPIKNISSKSFPVLVDQVNSSHSLVSLKQSVNVPNKDFVLTYELDKADSIKSGYLAYRNDQAKDKDGYATFMVLPPAKVTPASAAPKEMIFLVDCSGSQAGRPLDKAKETLDYIVDHMNSNDTFQVLAFNSEVDTLSDAPLKAGLEEKMRAHYFINNLTAQGGTWMAPAVARVLRKKQSDDKEPKRLRIVTFMTDGFVGNDLEIMKLVQKERGDSRWFVFGTGESVNRALIDNVSRLGGGEAEYVLLTSSAEEVGKRFYSRISSPALTDVKLKAEGIDLYDVMPGQVSDVWANKPLYFTARYRRAGHGKVVLTGFANGRAYQQALDVNLPAKETSNDAIEKVWARQKIAALTDQDLEGLSTANMNEAVKAQITKVALDHKLMCDFTSFVAVDTAVTTSGPSALQCVPSILPDGMAITIPYMATSAGSASQAAPTSSPNYGSPITYGGPLQGATNGTIAPQGADATIIQGVNTSGTVRVNNLANLEAVLNIFANGVEILCIAWGGATMVIGFRCMSREDHGGAKQVLLGAIIVLFGLATPCCINWLVAGARDANLFN